MEDTRKPARKPRAAAAPKPAAKKAVPASRAPAPKPAARTAPRPTAPSPAGREEMIRMAAYYRAERRGFVAGSEWDDWLAAEAEVRALLDGTYAPKVRKAPARPPKS